MPTSPLGANQYHTCFDNCLKIIKPAGMENFWDSRETLFGRPSLPLSLSLPSLSLSVVYI